MRKSFIFIVSMALMLPFSVFAQVGESLGDVGLDSYSPPVSSTFVTGTVSIVDHFAHVLLGSSCSGESGIYILSVDDIVSTQDDTSSFDVLLSINNSSEPPIEAGGYYIIDLNAFQPVSLLTNSVNLNCDVDGTVYQTIVPYSRDSIAPNSASPTYHDWLFVVCSALFLLAFVPIGFFYSVIRPKKY